MSLCFLFLQSLRHGKPCHLPLHKGGFGLVPLKRVYVTVAWLAGQSKAHLCAASSIRAMPEKEIPPAMRVDFYYLFFQVIGKKSIIIGIISSLPISIAIDRMIFEK